MATTTGTDGIPDGHVYKGTEVALISILLNIGSLLYRRLCNRVTIRN